MTLTEGRHEKDRDGRDVLILGRTPDKTCKECDLLSAQNYSKTYYRCAKNPKKNWKTKTQACMFFKKIGGEK